MARPLKHGESKTERKLRVTDTGWEGARMIASEHDCPGIGELVERIARRELEVVSPDLKPEPHPEPDISAKVEEVINTVLMTIPPRDRVAASKLFRKLTNQLKRG